MRKLTKDKLTYISIIFLAVASLAQACELICRKTQIVKLERKVLELENKLKGY